MNNNHAANKVHRPEFAKRNKIKLNGGRKECLKNLNNGSKHI